MAFSELIRPPPPQAVIWKNKDTRNMHGGPRDYSPLPCSLFLFPCITLKTWIPEYQSGLEVFIYFLNNMWGLWYDRYYRYYAFWNCNNIINRCMGKGASAHISPGLNWEGSEIPCANPPELRQQSWPFFSKLILAVFRHCFLYKFLVLLKSSTFWQKRNSYIVNIYNTWYSEYSKGVIKIWWMFNF